MTPEAKTTALARLKKISGQVDGLVRMLEQDRYCVDVLLQIAAVQSALGRVGEIVLGSHVETCVAEAFARGDARGRKEKTAELMDVFSRYAQLRRR
jgi:DNA-binding FrmR family transcriptional regulator